MTTNRSKWLMIRHTTENHDECSMKSGLNFQVVYP